MPQTVSLLSGIVLVIWAARGGSETLGRYASIALPVLLAVVALTVVLMIKDMRLENLMPVGENLHEVPRDALNNFSFPFAETVLFLGVLNTIKPGEKSGRAWLYGILIAGATLLFGMYFRNALVLGFPLLGDVIFPSYSATSVIIAGGFVSRIEAVVGANLLIAGLVKVGVCLLVCSKGVASLLGEREYRPYVAPLGLLMVALASIVYKNTIEMFEFLPVYAYYAFPFQVALPLLLCVAAEIKMKLKRKKERAA
jgi:spore germination protein KB